MASAPEYLEFVYLRVPARGEGISRRNRFVGNRSSDHCNPEVGSTIAETGGVRKLRYALRGRGKSGGARIIYYYRGAKGRVYMITA